MPGRSSRSAGATGKRICWTKTGYPPQFEVEPGKTVSLPYLAALLCLADELDIAAERNVSFLYDVEKMPSPRDRREFRKHMAIRRVELEPDRVVVHAWTEDPEIRAGVEEVTDKLRDKLLLCRRVAAERSSFVITQADVVLRMEKPEEDATMRILERVFHLTEQGTTVRRELLGALTSFFSVAYILFVTPSYLSQTGMDYTGVLLATCLSSALACFLSAALDLPFMLAPGVGLNAFFTYTLCLTMGYTWAQALAVVSLSGRGLSDHQPDPSAGPDDLLYPAQHEKRHQRRPGAVHRPHRTAELRHRPGGGRRAAAGGDRRPGHLSGHSGPADHRGAYGLEGEGGHADRHCGHHAAGLPSGGHPGAGIHEPVPVRPAPPAAVPGFRRGAVSGGAAPGHRRGHVYHVPVL